MDVKKAEGYKNIFVCNGFLKDKDKLYEKDRQLGNQFAKWLDRQLGYLDTTGLQVLINHKQAFEKVSGHNELFAITRREFKGNPRVLFFAIVEEGEEYTFVLLAAFHEQKTGDYHPAIEVAERRRKRVLEILQEGE